MAYDIRLVKIVTGELVIGKYDAEAHALNDVVIMQTVPTQQGVQLMMLPYGYPFDRDCNGRIEGKHFLFEHKLLMLVFYDSSLTYSYQKPHL